MKRTHRIKKVIRNTLLSILITFSFFVFSSSPKAATNSGAGTVQKSSTTYGTYSWMYSKAGILQSLEGSNTNWSTMSVVIDLNAYYSGNLTITISGVSNFANVGIFVQGAYIAQKSTNQVQVQLVYSNKVIIEFYSTTPYVSTSYNWTCAVGVGTLNKIDDSEASSLDNIDSTVNNISAAITSNTNGLPAIYNKLGNIENAILTLSSINNYLSNQQQLANYFPDYNLQGYLWGISYGGYSTLYDSQIPYASVGNSVNDNQYTNIHRILKPKDKDSVFYFIADQWLNDSQINILWQDTRFNTSYHVEVKQWYSSDNPNGYHALYLCKLTVVSNNTFDTGYEVEFNVNSLKVYPVYIGNPDMLPDNLALMLGIDFNNTYTRLLQQIATGIGNISQQQIIENNTNINNYNNYQQQINNVENNYYQQFNNTETNIENNNTFDFTGLSTDGVQVYHNLFSNVYGISLVKWPVLITLLGLVIVIILG